MATILVYNKEDALVTEYESNAIPNVGDNVSLYLGIERYCKGKVLKRTFTENTVILEVDTNDKPVTEYDRYRYRYPFGYYDDEDY